MSILSLLLTGAPLAFNSFMDTTANATYSVAGYAWKKRPSREVVGKAAKNFYSLGSSGDSKASVKTSKVKVNSKGDN